MERLFLCVIVSKGLADTSSSLVVTTASAFDPSNRDIETQFSGAKCGFY